MWTKQSLRKKMNLLGKKWRETWQCEIVLIWFAILFFFLLGLWVHEDSAAVSIFVAILVELTITVFVNSTNKSTNIETAVLSKSVVDFIQLSQWPVASFYQSVNLCLRLFVMIFMFAPEFFLKLISVNLYQHHPSSLYFVSLRLSLSVWRKTRKHI